MGRKRIAIVVQRYGPEVLGGSESLARSLAHLLSDVYDIDVLTTCAKDYVTWKNEFPPGESMDGPVKVRRFAVDHERSKLFNLYNGLMLNVPHTRWMEELWMRMQGPDSSGLINFIRSHRRAYDSLFFLTYLYATTYYGLGVAGDKCVIIPTAHDEPFLRFGIFREVFRQASKIVCLTEEERSLIEATFGPESGKCSVIGVPVGECDGDSDSAVKKYEIDGNFIAYVGRMDVMKGTGTLIDYFKRYLAERNTDLSLVLCGSGPLKVSETERIKCLGFIPEVDKYGLMRAATALVQPSRYESYSISVIESMMCGTPVLVNSDCDVLKGHCEKSGGGLTYATYEEFRDSLDRLVGEDGTRDLMARACVAYANDHYSTGVMGKKYISLVDGLTNKK